MTVCGSLEQIGNGSGYSLSALPEIKFTASPRKTGQPCSSLSEGRGTSFKSLQTLTVNPKT
jgi:hypothetical protein